MYLTIDDGPSTQWTPQMLSELRRLGIHATFFLVGENVAAHPDLVRAEVAGGNAVEDHTWDHPGPPNYPDGLASMSAAQIDSELRRTRDALASVTGSTPDLWRPPGGSHDAQTDAIGRSLGLQVITWDIDSEDWRLPGVDAIVHNVVDAKVCNGAVILMHDAGGSDRSESLAAVPRIVQILQSRGYDFGVLQ